MADEKPVDDNPVTTVWATTEDALIKKDTPEKPITKETTWNLSNEIAKIAKIDGVIKLWQARRKVHQDILDKHATEFGK